MIMKIGDKIKVMNQVVFNKKLKEFPELKGILKLGGEYEISKIWSNAVPQTLYGLDVSPNCGFTEDEIGLIQLDLHIDPDPRMFIKTFEGFGKSKN